MAWRAAPLRAGDGQFQRDLPAGARARRAAAAAAAELRELPPEFRDFVRRQIIARVWAAVEPILPLGDDDAKVNSRGSGLAEWSWL